jgi:hypothetical protein
MDSNNYVQSNADASQTRVIIDQDDAADAILDRWTDGETLSQNEDQEATDVTSQEHETTEETSDDNQDDEENELQDTEDDQDPETDPENDNDNDDDGETAEDDSDQQEEEEVELSIDDDTQVEVIVDGETQRVSVKDLKRLHGQEASLTRKSQDLANTRKQADEALQKADISYQKLLERAEARFKPYGEVDMLVASRQMEPDEFAKLRNEARDAEADLKFLKEESTAFYKDAQDQQKVLHQRAATDCVKVLQEQMPEWSNDLYNDIRNYAVQSGLPQSAVDQYVDPQVIMLLNKARLYDQSKATATTKKAKAKVIKAKTDNKGKRILRSNKAPLNEKGSSQRRSQKATDMLRSSGGHDADDIAEALLARWEQ